jgi:hypothetical protein
VSRRSTENAVWLFKGLAGLAALAAGFGVSMAISQGSSTEVGQTTASPDFGVATPVAPLSTVPGTPSYATPDGVLTSWRFHSSSDAAAGAVRLKIFRYTGTGLAFQVLAESSLKTLAPDTAYEFKERIPVDTGNLLGLTAVDDAEVGITVAGTPQNRLAQFGGGDIPPGQTGTATIAWPDRRPSVAATIESDADNDGFGDDTQDKCPVDRSTQALCRFGFGKVKRNEKKGTAILPVTVPGAGTLALSGKGVVKQEASASRAKGDGKAVASARTVRLLVKAKGKARGKLNRGGKTRIKAVVTFTPNGGPPVAQPRHLKLVKQLG